MQWSSARNGGFSTAAKPVRPLISDGPYGYSRVNVAAGQADPASLLNQVTRLGSAMPRNWLGKWKVLDTGSANVLAMRYDWQGRSLLMLHNFSSKPQFCQLPDFTNANSRLVSLSGTASIQAGPTGQQTVQLAGYGWYRFAN